jgi:thiosulfate dehydrogenase (quinone) large subunit
MGKKSGGGGNGGFIGSFSGEKTFLGFFAMLRVFLGWVFLKAGWGKYLDGYLSPEISSVPLAKILKVWLFSSPVMPAGWYREFIEGVVLPNAHLFGALLCLGELAVGALLMLGLGTRLAGLLGAFLAANIYLASGHLGPAQALINQLVILNCLLLALAAAGRAWGADFFLRRALPKVPLW